MYIMCITILTDGESVTETVEHPTADEGNVESQQTPMDSTEEISARQVSGKRLATPAVRKMAMENNVSCKSPALDIICVTSVRLKTRSWGRGACFLWSIKY